MSAYHRPGSVEEAVGILRDSPGAIVLAGGTDLVIDRRLGRVDPDAPLVDVTAIAELSRVHWDGDVLHIGAAAAIRDIECDPNIVSRAPALSEAARVLGSVQIRNMATLGGNLCNASPAADMTPPLLVHDAVVMVHGPGGVREQALGSLATGPRATNLATHELVLEIRMRVPARGGSCYVRQTVRWAMDLAGVGAAARVLANGAGPDAAIEEVQVALGAVAPTAALVPELDHLLVGHPLSPERLAAVREVSSGACAPISDVRGTAEHRRHVAGVLAARALSIAHARATSSWPGGPAPVNGRVQPAGIGRQPFFRGPRNTPGPRVALGGLA